ncbi:MAG: accessory factor UbiK family protein [Methylotenera sp.]|nr:accessory factor UbiK family protein [Methylotenera sp.]
MLDLHKINEISNKIKEVIESSPLGDVDKNINALLKGMFTKMELVSREEFDVQAEVLCNTRQKLELLEAKLAELEAKSVELAAQQKP